MTGYALRHGGGGVTDEAVARFPEYVDNVVAMMDAEALELYRSGFHPSYGVDEVMVHPVAGAHEGTAQGSGPAREETLRLLAP